jgi:hypothetical protein
MMTAGHDGATGHHAAATDRALWLRLHAVLAEHPMVPTEPSGRATPALTAHPPRTVRQVDRLAQHLSLALLPAGEPVPPGTARAVARWLVGICQAFVGTWSACPAATPAQRAEFERDVACLVAILRGVATSTPRRPRPHGRKPDLAPRPG